ncbi:MAG: iron hydrogenase [Candidatus Paceibacterota bacterium]
MENEQIKKLSIVSPKVLLGIKFIALLGIALLAPLAQNQIITGTIVNAVLLLSVFILGLRGAAAIAFFPSVISLGLGLLPGVMAPMVPFIITGNLIFVSVFAAVKNKNYWLGAISASVLKFVWLFVASQLVISLFIQKPIVAKIVAMMSWPQLLTALLAGIVVYFIFQTRVKSK